MHCRHCGRTTTPPRRTFCSDLCVHAYRLQKSRTYAREVVFKRDNGVCFVCGLDTLDMKAVVQQAIRLGVKLPKHRRSFWDMHHEVAVLDGGTNDLSNLKTLCWFCHRSVTGEQRFERWFEWWDFQQEFSGDLS